ncbi:UbiA family prenyltransferase [Pedobacter africanus]|uniref:4-hydroxybenzoate polyprenyltransferase n=1 Tax=Pedobacter africanus TaxID=151894 RepID=A0A1W2DFX4_9SPHI|nr:UbiA family prenyltransferase [Pedobacter africanus]SMC96184.1 4-hydroxybenzoate polyprenyltransferase [Pedobacter africanus]
MNLLSIIRSQEWWAHKLPPLLAIGYATALMSKIHLYQTAIWLIFLLFSLVVGAIYVSVINDITDLDEDLASGKSNRIQRISPEWRWLIPVLCLVIGIGCTFLMYPDRLSCLLYLLSWIVFSLYSIKPFRLKNRGIWGVLADACGSHVFPGLLMVSTISYITGQQLNLVWFIAVGTWSFSYGLRGILWHQFADRDNDIKVKLNTYASKVRPDSFYHKAKWLFAIELMALCVMLYQLANIGPLLAMAAYISLVCIRYLVYKNQIILVMKKDDRPFQILMADYYQLFWPLSLLLAASFTDHLNITVLIVHILLFPYVLWLAIYDYMYAILTLIRKK